MAAKCYKSSLETSALFTSMAKTYCQSPFRKIIYEQMVVAVLKNKQSMTACSLLCMCYNSVVNYPGAETRTLEITHKLKISATTLCDERKKKIFSHKA